MTNHLYISDLPNGLNLGNSVAIDCETMGLNPHRDRLCVVQLSNGDGDAHIIQFRPGQTTPVYCTKIASRLIRTYTDRHGLKNLLQEMLGVDVSKQQQSSDWGADNLTDAQLDYAASDVLYLHRLRDELNKRLLREGRMEMAQACFDFLPMRAQLDLSGWPETDIFAHS